GERGAWSGERGRSCRPIHGRQELGARVTALRAYGIRPPSLISRTQRRGPTTSVPAGTIASRPPFTNPLGHTSHTRERVRRRARGRRDAAAAGGGGSLAGGRGLWGQPGGAAVGACSAGREWG